MAAFHVTSYQLLSLITQCHRLRSPVCHLAVASCLLPVACCKLQVGSQEFSQSVLSQKQEAFYVLLSFNVSLITLCNTLPDRQRRRQRQRESEREKSFPLGAIDQSQCRLAWPIIRRSLQVQNFYK